MKIKIAKFSFLITLLLTTSCSNILDEFAKKDTDEALLYEAYKNMNSGLWDLAIGNFEDMSADYLTKREVKIQYAKAYAGRCGLDLLQLFEDLSSNLSTGRLYVLLMTALSGATVTEADDCAQAESIMLSISQLASSRTGEENTTLAFISFAKMGAIFSAFADETTPDGTTDADFNGCSNTVSPGISESYVREIGIGLAIASTSLTEAINSGGLSGADELTIANQTCTALATLGSQYDFCDETDPDNLTADQVKAIRWTMVDNQVLGLGGATSCDLSGVNCPVVCP